MSLIQYTRTHNLSLLLSHSTAIKWFSMGSSSSKRKIQFKLWHPMRIVRNAHCMRWHGIPKSFIEVRSTFDVRVYFVYPPNSKARNKATINNVETKLVHKTAACKHFNGILFYTNNTHISLLDSHSKDHCDCNPKSYSLKFSQCETAYEYFSGCFSMSSRSLARSVILTFIDLFQPQ